MGACATNNRYLHDNTVILAEKLAKTLPEDLTQIFYTNSAYDSRHFEAFIELIFSLDPKQMI